MLFRSDYKAKRRIIVKNDETGEETEYLIAKGKHVSVQEGDFVRRGDREGLLALGKVEGNPVITAVVRGTRWTTDGIELVIDASIAGRLGLPRQMICEVLRRDGDGASAFPIVRRSDEIPSYGETSQYLGILPDRSISALLPGTYDVNVASVRPEERLSARLRWDERLQPPATRTGFRLYQIGRAHV